MKQKLLQFDSKKVVKTLKNKFGCDDNEVNPYFFVFVDNVTTRLVRSASALLLNVNNCKNQIFCQNMPRLAQYLKYQKRLPKSIAVSINQNYPNQA